MDLDEFVRQIWEIRESVHVEIDSVRTEVYKIHGHKRDWKGSSKLQAEQTKKLDDDAFQIMQTAQENINHLPLQNSKNLNDLAQTAEQTARKLQRNTEQVTSATPVSVLLMTTKAGFLLSLTERVMFGYARLGSSTPKPDDDVVLSAAMTVVASDT